MAARHDELLPFTWLVSLFKVVPLIVQICGLYPVVGCDARYRLSSDNRVIYAIYGEDEKLQPLLDEPWGIHKSFTIAPDDRLWGQAELNSDVKDGVTRLDDIGDDLCAQSLRDGRVKDGQTSNDVGVRGTGPIGG